MRDPNESAVDKGVSDRFTRVGEGTHLEEDLLTKLNARSGHDQIPIDSFQRHVFPCRPNINGMALGLKPLDPFQGIYANGSLWSAVALRVILSVTLKT
jgi:hypothetical protein